MTLLHAEGFEDGTTGWTLVSAAVGAGRFGNGIVASGTSGYASRGLTRTVGPLVCGCAINPTGATPIMSLVDDAGSAFSHISIVRGAGGEVQMWKGNGAQFSGSSATGVIPVNAWSYVEWKVFIDPTTGYSIVRVNGIEVFSRTNIDSTMTGTNTGLFKIGTMLGVTVTTSTGSAWDDVYICDTNGSVNNDYLGEVHVEHLRPNGDDGVQFVGSDTNSVDNWALVDEAGTYSGADYVASATSGQRDLYTVGASSRAGSTPVLGVVANAVAMKSDIGARTVKLDIKEGSGGTVRQSAELGLPGGFGELSAVFERKADGSQWTVADVNALRIGMEVAT